MLAIDPLLELTTREGAVLNLTMQDLNGPPMRLPGNCHPAEYQLRNGENAPEEHHPQIRPER